MTSSRSIVGCLALTALLCACEGEWSAPPEEGAGPLARSEIGASAAATRTVKIRLTNGTLIVLDGSGEVRAFRRDGAHLWSAGGGGEGGFEFENPSSLTRIDGNRVRVEDRNEVYDFSATGERVGTNRSGGTEATSQVEGALAVAMGGSPRRRVVAMQDPFRLEVYEASGRGRLLRVIEFAGAVTPPAELTAGAAGDVDGPVLFIDDLNYIWVKTGDVGEFDIRWEIVNGEGEHLGPVYLGSGLRVFEIGESYLLGAERDGAGADYLVRYSVSRGR